MSVTSCVEKNNREGEREREKKRKNLLLLSKPTIEDLECYLNTECILCALLLFLTSILFLLYDKDDHVTILICCNTIKAVFVSLKWFFSSLEKVFKLQKVMFSPYSLYFCLTFFLCMHNETFFIPITFTTTFL